MDVNNAPCPSCGQDWALTKKANSGERTFCQHCGSLLELSNVDPPQVVKISLQAEDFGV